MYTNTRILCPYFQDFSPEVQQLLLDELFPSHQSPSLMTESSFTFEHDLGGGQADLFKEPEPVFHEPITSLDPMSMTPLVDQSSMPTQDQEFVDFENTLFDKVLYENVFANSSAETHQINETMEVHNDEKQLMNELSAFQKSISTGSLSSSMAPLSMRPSFLDFEADYGMRRAFSEGDIRTLGDVNLSFIQTSVQWPRLIGFGCSSEGRQEKLSRYRFKKLKRNYGRKIKYACRKALADSQPRIRGRFAKTQDTLSCRRENKAN